MPNTFLYSPGIKIYINTYKQSDTIYDVSADVSDGSIIRRSDGVSTANFTLLNARRKYDGFFMPNDRVVIMLKRITWLRVFTGYLNTVPLVTIWPKPVHLSASCSLKRLQYWYWDSALPASQELIYTNIIAGANATTKNTQTGGKATPPPSTTTAGANKTPPATSPGDASVGISNAVRVLLKKVVGWPEEKVHLSDVPDSWYTWILPIAKAVIPELEADQKEPTLKVMTAWASDRKTAQSSGGGGGGGGAAAPGGGGNATVPAGSLGIPDLKKLAQAAGFTGNDITIAAAVAMAESSGKPDNTNSAGNSAGVDRGLWQINDYYNKDLFAGGVNWKDPNTNAKMAFKVFQRAGWKAWSVYKGGQYQKFMK